MCTFWWKAGAKQLKKIRNKSPPRVWLTLFRLEEEATFNTKQFRTVNTLFSVDKGTVQIEKCEGMPIRNLSFTKIFWFKFN